MGTYVEVKAGNWLESWELEPMLQAVHDSCGGLRRLTLRERQSIRDLIEHLHLAARDGGQVIAGIDD